jgi:hypothetical protein
VAEGQALLRVSPEHSGVLFDFQLTAPIHPQHYHYPQYLPQRAIVRGEGFMILLSLRRLVLLLPLLVSGVISAAPSHSRSTAAAASATRSGSSAALNHKLYLPLSIHLFDPTYVNPFGIVMYGNVDPAHGLPQMQAVGAKRVTTFLDWGTIQPNEQTLDWSSFDTKVRNAQAAGMEVFALFTGDPAWAWNADRSATIPEKRRTFVRAMIQRYDCDGRDDAPGGLCVRQWSFYAEPDFYVDYYQDNPGYKGYWGKRGAEYAQMLADVATVVHAEDPAARVMIGGLAYDAFLDHPGDTRGFVREFLPIVLATLNARPGGVRAYLDAIAVHYYSLQFPSIRDKIAEIRGIMQTHGAATLPVLVPETGYWSSQAVGSSELKQAQRLVQIYVEGLSAGAQEISYFTVFDSGAGMEASGLFHGQDLNRPKLAYSAYRALTGELAGAKYVRLLNQAGVKGYVFRTPRGSEKTVFWGDKAAGSAIFGSHCSRVVDTFGVARIVNDGGAGDSDGRVNGQIRVVAGADDPLYLESCQ